MARVIKIDNALQKRHEYKKNKRKARTVICRILIVCEGEKTEPNYFRSFDRYRKGNIVYELTLDGGRMNTVGVVDKAISLRDKANIPYDRVWAVFDKDGFPTKNFNTAIAKANQNHIECAWSNEAFELWYLYHFHNRITGMTRDEYAAAITKAVNASPLYKKKTPYQYAKNDKSSFDIVTTFGSQDNAIRWAETKHDEYTDERYAMHNPCTTVYRLVRQLTGTDEGLNNEIIRKIDE